MFLCGILRAEVEQFPIRKERVTRADDRGIYGALDEIIGKEYVITTAAIIENKESVLAIGRGDTFLKTHVIDAVIKGFYLTSKLKVTIGKDDAVLVWE